MKKSFTTENPATKFFTPQPQGTTQPQETVEPQTTPPAHETPRQYEIRTGEKLPRINMQLKPDLHEYLLFMSRVKGISGTAYINRLLEADRISQPESVKKAIEALKEAE